MVTTVRHVAKPLDPLVEENRLYPFRTAFLVAYVSIFLVAVGFRLYRAPNGSEALEKDS